MRSRRTGCVLKKTVQNACTHAVSIHTVRGRTHRSRIIAVRGEISTARRARARRTPSTSFESQGTRRAGAGALCRLTWGSGGHARRAVCRLTWGSGGTCARGVAIREHCATPRSPAMHPAQRPCPLGRKLEDERQQRVEGRRMEGGGRTSPAVEKRRDPPPRAALLRDTAGIAQDALAVPRAASRPHAAAYANDRSRWGT